MDSAGNLFCLILASWLLSATPHRSHRRRQSARQPITGEEDNKKDVYVLPGDEGEDDSHWNETHLGATSSSPSLPQRADDMEWLGLFADAREMDHMAYASSPGATIYDQEKPEEEPQTTPTPEIRKEEPPAPTRKPHTLPPPRPPPDDTVRGDGVYVIVRRWDAFEGSPDHRRVLTTFSHAQTAMAREPFPNCCVCVDSPEGEDQGIGGSGDAITRIPWKERHCVKVPRFVPFDEHSGPPVGRTGPGVRLFDGGPPMGRTGDCYHVCRVAFGSDHTWFYHSGQVQPQHYWKHDPQTGQPFNKCETAGRCMRHFLAMPVLDKSGRQRCRDPGDLIECPLCGQRDPKGKWYVRCDRLQSQRQVDDVYRLYERTGTPPPSGGIHVHDVVAFRYNLESECVWVLTQLV
ncbi:unnamed protein product [Vitrella brassicaformis CCMP3155]|uniref:Uncharacterized protein n=1 Tax=Vitrella brassicaformis (strain CCMP3155) TaxID=1169540 RepID=A0A0G4EY01_VITBC|nr:unnamed protein product [Vitrella brassicaformis CCMP3155]|eukprot:CEM03601.1 unnamed protein product [Vitrella brassicaformis CCMP3155]